MLALLCSKIYIKLIYGKFANLNILWRHRLKKLEDLEEAITSDKRSKWSRKKNQNSKQRKGKLSSLWATNNINKGIVNFLYKMKHYFDGGQKNGIQLKKQCFKKNRIAMKIACLSDTTAGGQKIQSS